MHDEMLERRLHDALRAEGDALGLTITSAELERRLAARRRGRTTRGFGLLLAAALSVGALGAAAVAGGVLNPHRPSPAPSQQAILPSASPTASPSPSSTVVAPLPSGSAAPIVSLTDLVDAVGPSRVAEADAYGAGTGVEHVVDVGPAAIELGPIQRSGAYRLWLVCDAASVVVERQDAAGNRVAQEVACGRQPAATDLSLEGGGRIRVAGPTLVGWRAVLEWLGGDVTEHATTITAPAPDSDTVIVQSAGGPAGGPTSGPLPSGGVPEPTVLGGIPTRASGSVLASCAGPEPIRVTIDPNEYLPTDVESTTEIWVPCDGRLHTDDLAFALTGGVLTVRADPRVVWQAALVGDASPITLDEGDHDWQTIMGIGPNLLLHPVGSSLSDAVSGTDHRVRVVVSCQGGSRVEVVVSGGRTVSQEVGRFTVPCTSDGATTVSQVFQLPSAGFNVDATPDGGMWLAVAAQEPRRGA